MRSMDASIKGREKEKNTGIATVAVKNIGALCCFILLMSAGKEVGCCLGLGLLGALLYGGRKYCFLYPIPYVVAAAFFGVTQFLSAGAGALVLTAVCFVYRNLKKKPHRALCIIYLIAAQLFYILFDFTDAGQLAVRLLGVGLSVLSGYVFGVILKALFLRAKAMPTTEELVCLAAAFATMVAGTELISILGTPLTRLVIPFCVLVLTAVLGNKGVTSAAVLGVGAAIASGSTAPLALFTLWALAAVLFMRINRYLAALALVLANLITMLLFFEGASAVAFIAPLLSAFAFVLLPGKILERAAARFSTGEKYCARHIVNRLRNNLSKRLFRLSEIFFAMQLTFKDMVRGVMAPEKARDYIVREVSEKVCASCPDRVKCWRVHAADTENTFMKMTESALSRGKATVLDVGNALVSRCGRINSLLASVNSEVYSYKQYYTMTLNSDSSKVLIAEQLGGVAEVLKELSREGSVSVSFDTAREKEVAECLAGVGILCKEAVIYEDGDKMCVSVAVDNEDISREDLSREVGRALRFPMMLDRTEKTEDSGWVVAHFVPRPPYDMVFGCASEKKYGSEASGDSHSFLKVSADKCIMVVCDGMGSGQEAEAASGRAISLIENFYRAGFNSDTVLASVNKLLSTAGEEVFTAVDIAVVDMMGGLADFIKIGAPSGIVKTGGRTEFTQSGSLPMGVLEESTPTVTKKALNRGDSLFLMSDGVEQAFGGVQPLSDFVDSLGDAEPQAMAQAIIECALSMQPKPKDDMTVIVGKLI